MTLGRHAFVAGMSAGDAPTASETEHVRQSERHRVAGFLARHVAACPRGRLAGLSHRDACRRIPFEEKARRAEARAAAPQEPGRRRSRA